MDHSPPVGVVERRADLSEEAERRVDVPRAPLQRIAQAPTPQPAGHQVGAVGLAPVVVERHDVGVLQLGDDVGLGLEAADELRLVDVLGPDHLDCHFPAHRRLVGAVHDPEVTRPDPFPQLVAPDRPAQTRCRDPRRHPVDPKRREVVGEALEQELEDVLGLAQTLEAVLAHGPHLPPAVGGGRQGSVGLLGQQHLATVRGGEDAGAPV